MNKKTILALVASIVLLVGCGTKEYNDAVKDMNTMNRKAYAEGMAACKGDAACQVGLSAAYFGNAGQMPLAKPDTALDYAKAALPFAQLWVQWDGSGNSTGSGGVTFRNVKFGRDAVISGFNTTKTSTTTITEDNNDREFSLQAPPGTGGINDSGVTSFEPINPVTPIL